LIPVQRWITYIQLAIQGWPIALDLPIHQR
jgi:hypothetical protein